MVHREGVQVSEDGPEPCDTAPAGRPVRMLDVARSLGVSRATVSLVMRDSPLVATATKDAVLAEADRLDYVYHRGAANLRTHRSDVVGMVMPDVVNPFVGEVSLGAQEVLDEHGFFVVIANTQDRLDAQRHMMRSLVEQRVAGLLTIPVLGTDDDQVAELLRARLPVVLLTRDLPGSGLPFVGPDDDAVGTLGARHLTNDHGCRRVAYFGGNTAAGPRIVRERAFRLEAEQRAEVVDAWNLTFDAWMTEANDIASALLETGPPPDGVLCHSDEVAYGVLRALHDHGIAPETCRVIGIDDLRHAATWIPSLSSIAVDPFELGRISARTLLQRLGSSDIDPGSPSAPRLVPRESCGCTLIARPGRQRRPPSTTGRGGRRKATTSPVEPGRR